MDKLLRKAAVSESDVLLLDLEDSVQPYSNKAIARELINHLQGMVYLDDKKIFPPS